MSQSDVADRIALTDVMLKYTKGVDQRDMDLYASVFDDNVEIVGFGTEPYHGRDVWVQHVIKALSAFGPTQHMLGPQLATVDGDTAQCRTDVQALHFFKDEPEKTLILWATYNTQMKRRNGEWKITRHELESRGRRIQVG